MLRHQPPMEVVVGDRRLEAAPAGLVDEHPAAAVPPDRVAARVARLVAEQRVALTAPLDQARNASTNRRPKSPIRCFSAARRRGRRDRRRRPAPASLLRDSTVRMASACGPRAPSPSRGRRPGSPLAGPRPTSPAETPLPHRYGVSVGLSRARLCGTTPGRCGAKGHHGANTNGTKPSHRPSRPRARSCVGSGPAAAAAPRRPIARAGARARGQLRCRPLDGPA